MKKHLSESARVLRCMALGAAFISIPSLYPQAATAAGIQMLPPLEGIAPASETTPCKTNEGSKVLTWDGQSAIGCSPGFVVTTTGVGIGMTILQEALELGPHPDAYGFTGIAIHGAAAPLASPGVIFSLSGDNLFDVGAAIGAAQFAGAFSNDSQPGDLVLRADMGHDVRITNITTATPSLTIVPTQLIVKNNGNVGIGTPSPQTPLEVSSPSETNITIESQTENNTGLIFHGNGNVVPGYGAGGIVFNNSAVTGPTYGNWGASLAIIQPVFTSSSSTSGADLTFITKIDGGQPTEKMRISNNGNVGIGTPNPSSVLDIRKTGGAYPGFIIDTAGSNFQGSSDIQLITQTTGIGGLNKTSNQGWQISARGSQFSPGPQQGSELNFSFWNGTTWSTGLWMMPNGNVGIGNSNPSYALDVSGQARFTGNYTTSDRRLKTNIVDISYGLDTVMKLHPVFFDWKKPVQGEDGRRVGFIAQEVEAVIPEVVTTAPDEMKTKAVEYGNVTPVLVKAIQQLKADNDSLRAEFEAYRKAHP